MEKVNILFLSYLYPPIGGQGLPGAQRSVKFIKHFKKCAAVVLTIKESSCPPFFKLNYDKELPINKEIIHRIKIVDVFNVIINLRTKLQKLFSKKSHGNNREHAEIKTQSDQKSSAMNVHRGYFHKVKDFIHDLSYFPDYASGWILPALYHGCKIAKREKIDIIFATGMPWSSLIAAYLLHIFTDLPYIVDFRDPWIGNPYQVSKGRFLDRLQIILEKKIVGSASIVCANTEKLKHDFLARYPYLNQDKFMVLPNGYDIDDFVDPEQSSSPSPNKQLVLAHAGLLYKQRDPQPIYKVLEELIAEYPELTGKIKFLQIGDIQLSYDPTRKYQQLYEKNMLENIEPVGYDECLKILGSSDILVIIQPDTLSQVPSKLYDYLCLNKPILTLAPLHGELNNLIRTHNFGHLVEPNDVNGLKNIILKYLNEKAEQGNLSAAYADKKLFDVRTITEKLEEKILSISYPA